MLLGGFPSFLNAKAPKFPPYPDIWGYDLMEDFNQDINMRLSESLMKNGDYLLRYPSTKTPGNDKTDYTFLFYFEQKKKAFKGIEEAMKYFDTLGFEPGEGIKPYIILKDKTKDKKIIDINQNPAVLIKYHQMNSMHENYIRRLDDFNSDKPSDYEVSPIGIATHCDAKQVCINWAYSMARRIIKLEDDTFFVFNPRYYLFLRFDRNFKTKFKPQHTVKLSGGRELKSNFYILPYAKVEYFFDHVATGYKGDYTEDINRQFLDYLYNEEQSSSGA